MVLFVPSKRGGNDYGKGEHMLPRRRGLEGFTASSGQLSPPFFEPMNRRNPQCDAVGSFPSTHDVTLDPWIPRRFGFQSPPPALRTTCTSLVSDCWVGSH